MPTASTSSSSSTSAPMTASEIRARVRRQKVDPRVSLDVYFRTAEHVHLQVRARSRRARDARRRVERSSARARSASGDGDDGKRGRSDWIGTRRRLTERTRATRARDARSDGGARLTARDAMCARRDRAGEDL